MPDCERCGTEAERLYDFTFKNEDDETITKKICWDCDFDIINGRGDFYDDSWEVLADRRENDYAFDPINNPRPY